MFVKAKTRELHPISEVEKVWFTPGPNNTIDGFASIKELGFVPLFYGEYERLSNGPSKIIAAQSGYQTLHLFSDGDSEVEVLSNAVLGWSIAQDGEVSPITIEGADNGDAGWHGILTPDGEIIDRTGKIDESLEQFKSS